MEYTAKVTFIHYKGEMKPWKATFVSTRAPFETFIVKADGEHFKGNFVKDKIQNRKIPEYTHPGFYDDVPSTFYHPREDIGTYISETLYAKNFDPYGWIYTVGAVDYPTFKYLKDLLPSVVLLKNFNAEQTLCSALALKYAAEQKDKTLRELIEKKLGEGKNDNEENWL